MLTVVNNDGIILGMADTQTQERMHPTSVNLDTDTKRLLTELADAEERSRSQIVRRAIVAYADQKETP